MPTRAVTLGQFRKAASGGDHDTTIWARFVQPCALIWAAEGARETVIGLTPASRATSERVVRPLERRERRGASVKGLS